MREKERCLIINADDFGMCHTTNQAIASLLNQRWITSASLMMNCAWTIEAVEILRQHPEWDVGIHLTHTSQWKHYKWGPLSKDSHTLVDENGYFHSITPTVVKETDPDQLYREAVAQMEMALKMGIDPTNIDNHMGSMGHRMDMLLELCETYRLPLRYPKRTLPLFTDAADHERVVKEAEKRGVVLPDEVKMLPFYPDTGVEPVYSDTKEAAKQIIRDLKPGVTELVLHPSLDTDELKAITPTWPVRRFEFDVFLDEEIKALLQEQEIKLIYWRDLKELQRS
ncbi:polysaccharide deacetylase family protein [Paenibacillus sp. GD4]|uniref:polysaccharide deacetylase family protein n=1 Tax=Paenibacillus sp. GD4 TaxID=3068890 RepID=UPI002796A013|nr:polysaccharide deacetylase family protein [Paenibacillus sp. GD4]MDQ1914125.1 polysaccharide deacetylase family protein [Paenibacillus sp. GD4]